MLTWGVGEARQLQQASAREVLAAAQRGNDVVVADLPRHLDGITVEVLGRCDHVVLVSALTVPGVAAAGRVAAQLRGATAHLALVTRGRAGGVLPDQVADTLGLPLLAAMADQKRLAEHIDLGLGPVHARRGPLARAARTVCEQLLPAVPVAA